MAYWLMKTEPGTYGWDDLVRDERTHWDGVRNYQARNNIRAMRPGDLAFIYHSVKEKRIVGIAQVTSDPYPDPTAEEGDWSVVDIKPVKGMKEPVALAQAKDAPSLADMVLANNTRLSVQPVRAAEWKEVLKLGRTDV